MTHTQINIFQTQQSSGTDISAKENRATKNDKQPPNYPKTMLNNQIHPEGRYCIEKWYFRTFKQTNGCFVVQDLPIKTERLENGTKNRMWIVSCDNRNCKKIPQNWIKTSAKKWNVWRRTWKNSNLPIFVGNKLLTKQLYQFPILLLNSQISDI